MNTNATVNQARRMEKAAIVGATIMAVLVAVFLAAAAAGMSGETTKKFIDASGLIGVVVIYLLARSRGVYEGVQAARNDSQHPAAE